MEKPMLTIFAIPKPFEGHIGVIQRNAITSWTLLEPRPEIILFGDERGTEEMCLELGLLHHPHVEKNEFGTPLVDSIFHSAQEVGVGHRMMYANCDMIFTNDLITAVQSVPLTEFLLIGKRSEIDIEHLIDFNNPRWAQDLTRTVEQFGKDGPASAIDYFNFNKGMYQALPRFAIGRIGWDNWLIWHTKERKIKVVDASPCVRAVHQNHGYSHLRRGADELRYGIEAKQNVALAGGWLAYCNLDDADFVLTSSGTLSRPPINIRRSLRTCRQKLFCRVEGTFLEGFVGKIVAPSGVLSKLFRWFFSLRDH
jgi:hypothetical protein